MSEERKLEAGFSWSASRANPWCWRREWFHRIAAWGGWEKDASSLAREAYRLKKLENRWGWPGKLAHRYYAKLLTSLFQHGEVEPLERVLTYAEERFWTTYSLSESAVNSREENFGHDVVYIEHFYPLFPSASARHHAFLREWRKIRYALITFYHEALPHFRGVKQEDVLELDQAGTDHTFTHFWHRPKGLSFPVKVFVELDLGIRVGDSFVITDWKTGRRDAGKTAEHRLEMLVHARYVQAAHGISIAKVRADLVYLSDTDSLRLSERTHSVSAGEFDLELAAQEMDSRIVEWTKRFADPEKSTTHMSMWPTTTDSNTCVMCNFRRICQAAPVELRKSSTDESPLELSPIFEAEESRVATFLRSKNKETRTRRRGNSFIASREAEDPSLKLPF